MSQALTPALQRKEVVKIRKHRELSVPGRLLVKIGDKVTASQIVAEAEFPGEITILRIPEQLGIEPAEVMRTFSLKEGDQVKDRQVLCTHKGLFGFFKSTFITPHPGVIDFINRETGHIGLRMPSRNIVLDAYIAGTIVEIEEQKSVVIEADAAFIQGIFGVGSEKRGILTALNVAPSSSVTADDIPDNVSGKILFGGCSPDIEALNKAQRGGATGFLTGSIDDRALKDFLGYDLGIALTGNENLSMTLILTEGFGKLAFSQRALELLKRFEGREASINGATQVRAGAVRPEIIIPHAEAASDTAPSSMSVLEIGASVRIIREPYFGMQANVIELPVHAEKIETGAEVRILKAKLDDGRLVTVPRANVEIQD